MKPWKNKKVKIILSIGQLLYYDKKLCCICKYKRLISWNNKICGNCNQISYTNHSNMCEVDPKYLYINQTQPEITELEAEIIELKNKLKHYKDLLY